MNPFIDYDPKKHEGFQLYEIQSKKGDNTTAVVAVPSDVPHKLAKLTPWYYVVRIEDKADSEAKS